MVELVAVATDPEVDEAIRAFLRNLHHAAADLRERVAALKGCLRVAPSLGRRPGENDHIPTQ